MKLTTSFISCLILLSATSSLAAELHTKRTPEEMEKCATERFKKQDVNGDGILSKDEFLSRSEKRFNEMDTDHDGKLTPKELNAARAAKKAAFEKRLATKAK